MGISKTGLRLILNEIKRRAYNGSLLTLGEQELSFDLCYAIQAIKEAGLERLLKNHVFTEKELKSKEYVDSKRVFSILGFSECFSLDYSDYEGADIMHDLNYTVPKELHNKFDMIIDGGTIEHIFHLPNVMENLFLMLKKNGRMMHLAPSCNYIDHGFYMFSPTFFWDFYSENKFQIDAFKLCRLDPVLINAPWWGCEYHSGLLGLGGQEVFDDGVYGVFCVMTKTDNSTGNRIPQQGCYKRIKSYYKESFSEAKSPVKENPFWSFVSRKKKNLKKNFVLFYLAKFLYRPFKVLIRLSRNFVRKTKGKNKFLLFKKSAKRFSWKKL